MNYISSTVYKNRYNDQYKFIKHSDNSYELEGDLNYFRTGFKDSPDDIIFIDPSGGPFLQINSFSIDDQKVTKIECKEGTYLFSV